MVGVPEVGNLQDKEPRSPAHAKNLHWETFSKSIQRQLASSTPHLPKET